MNYIGSSKAQKHSMVTELKRGMTNVIKAIITNKGYQILRTTQLAAQGSLHYKISEKQTITVIC